MYWRRGKGKSLHRCDVETFAKSPPWYDQAGMVEQARPTLDYARRTAPLPPPNDAIGLPRGPRPEALNPPARWAALLAVIVPWFFCLPFLIVPHSHVAARVTAAALLILPAADFALAVWALKDLRRAGRDVPVIVVALIAMAADVFFGIVGLAMIVFPFGGM
jgi:hypothetical protein